MRLFKVEGQKMEPMKEIGFDREKRIQQIMEENLQVVFGLKFVRSEFSVHGSRIDTLAFDEETRGLDNHRPLHRVGVPVLMRIHY